MSLGPESFAAIEAWAQAGIPLGDAERTSMWRIGDWYILGAKLFGRGACKRIVEADEWQGPSYAVCRTAASIARRFPEVSRRLDLGFSHHQAVAAVHRTDTEAALRLLDAAACERWTDRGWPPPIWILHEDLQDQITKLTEELGAARKVKTTGAMPPNMSAEDFASMLAEQMSQTTRRRFAEAFRKAMETEDRQDRIEAGLKARK